MGRFCLGNVLVDKSMWIYLERCLEEVSPIELRGESLMIDGDHWILEISKLVTTSSNLILAFYNRCLRLLECGINPVVYFDPIKDKSVRTDRRRAIDGIIDTNSLLEMLWKLLTASNIKVVFAKISTLVDATKLDENGHGGLVTNDLEYVLVGGRNVYQIDFTRDGTGIEKISLFSMGVIEDTFGFSRNRLIALSMLMGCNTFPKGVTGIGVVTGIEILSEFSNDKDDHPLTIFERFRAYRQNELPVRKDDSPIKMRLRRMKLRVSPTADEVWEDRLEHFMCNPPPLSDEHDNQPTFTSRPAPSLQEITRICGLDAEQINSMLNFATSRYIKSTSDIVKQSTSSGGSSRRRFGRKLVLGKTTGVDEILCSRREYIAFQSLLTRNSSHFSASLDDAGTSSLDSRSDLTSNSRLSHTIESSRQGVKRPALPQAVVSGIKKPKS